MSRNISYQVRCGLTVATAVAEEIVNKLCTDKNVSRPIRPVLLSMPTSLTFHYVGGITVQVELYDYRKETRGVNEDWWVKSVNVRYYDARTDKQVNETWRGHLLTCLKERRPWINPPVWTLRHTRFKVAAFHDPDYHKFVGIDIFPYHKLCNGYYLPICEVDYDPAVPGDIERASREAWEIYKN